jgi:hypothetical protein
MFFSILEMAWRFDRRGEVGSGILGAKDGMG